MQSPGVAVEWSRVTIQHLALYGWRAAFQSFQRESHRGGKARNGTMGAGDVVSIETPAAREQAQAIAERILAADLPVEAAVLAVEESLCKRGRGIGKAVSLTAGAMSGNTAP